MSATPGSAPLWHEASAFAARRHRHQLRNDGKTPYFSHLCRVTLTVSVLFGCTDERVLAAALLHDTIEDTTTDFDDIADRFGDDVARMVAALSKDMRIPDATRDDDYDRAIAAADWRVRLIKLADIYDNLSDIASNPEKLERTLERAGRALRLARVDAERHAEIRTAISRVEQLVATLKPN